MDTKILLEVLHEGAHWIPCEYMARVVESIAPEFGDALVVKIIVTKEMEGALRYQEISKSLGRPAPVPSIFVEGELAFDQTPPLEALRSYIKPYLAR